MVVILIVGSEPVAAAPSPQPSSSAPSISIISSGSQVSPDDIHTKEEEWVKKKKVEVVTKRQIATRVQRNVLLKDGKVVEDSGPKVTTTTTEDTQRNESENTEHHDIAPEEGRERNGWVALQTAEPGLLQEVREKKVTTRKVKDETIETEDIKHLGDISDEVYRKAVVSGEDIEKALEKSKGFEIVGTGPRVIGHTTRSKKVTDIEDTLKKSTIDANGKIITNSSTIREHDEVKEVESPEKDEEESVEEFKVGKSDYYHKTKDQEFVDYLEDGIKVGTEMRYNAENTEATRLGDSDWDSLSARLRRMKRTRLLQEVDEIDRKDALTRRPLDFEQEERTRKVETNKWLEHHFGSDSSRAGSRDSDEEGTHSSFISVTMKSARDPYQPSSKAFLGTSKPYFQGVSEWKSEERKEVKSPRVQVLPTGPDHSFHNSSPSPPYNGTKSPSPPHIRTKTPSPPYSKSHSPPYNGDSFSHPDPKFPSTVNLERSSPASLLKEEKVSKYYSHERTSSPYGRSSPLYNGSRQRSSPEYRQLNGKSSPKENTPPRVSPPPRRRHRKQENDVNLREEPAPDYSPERTPDHRSSPRDTPTPDQKKRVYQRTRFAADIPPPPPPPPGSEPAMTGNHKSAKGRSLGESFRKLVGKLRSTSGDRKNGSSGGGGSKSAWKGGRGSKRESGTQTGEVQKFYLGEDPFQGSIYGKESEYDGVQEHKHRKSHSRHNSSSTLGRLSKSTSKLSGNERPHQNGSVTNSAYYSDRGGVQTLPRKLEQKAKKEVHVTRSNAETSADRYNRLSNNSNSMFNVSIVNNVSPSASYLNGPTKPARTYRSNLLRSKSFNVHADPTSGMSRYISNPNLHRLDSSHAPLKSPGIVTSISRSTRDLSEAVREENRKTHHGLYDRYPKVNGYNPRSAIDAKKKIFMKGLMERAPELYKTLHENEKNDLMIRNSPEPRYSISPLRNGKLEYSTSFRSNSPLDRVSSPVYNSSIYSNGSGSDVNRSMVRRGSNDFTETVRYVTKSDDPYNPSETNTVKSFTKKTIPGRNGRQEIIERSETNTVTKSRFRSGTPELKYLENGNKYAANNGGVVIEVRNTRK